MEKRDLTPGSHLSAVARHTAASVEKSCSFEAYRSSQALLVPLGTALIIAAFAILHFRDLVSFDLGGNGRALGVLLDDAVRIVSKDLIDTNYAEEHVVSMLLFVIVLAAGVAVHRGRTISDPPFERPILTCAGRLMRKRSHGKRSGRRLVLAAAVLALGGIVLHAATRSLGPADTPGTTALFDSQASPPLQHNGRAVVLLFAVAVFLFMREAASRRHRATWPTIWAPSRNAPSTVWMQPRTAACAGSSRCEGDPRCGTPAGKGRACGLHRSVRLPVLPADARTALWGADHRRPRLPRCHGEGGGEPLQTNSGPRWKNWASAGVS